MNITQIEENIKQLTTDFQANKIAREQFVYDFLLAYGHRKSSVSRVKSGERNLSKVVGEVRWKRHVFFKYVEGDNLRLETDKLKNDKAITRDRIRFVIVTDFNKFLAIDVKTGDSLDIKFNEIVKHFDFFLPWAGMEKAVYQGENPADVKAAEKMAKLFDIIKADNFNETNKNDIEALHNLNVFLTRLLFCFFAEDTKIFTSNQFSHALESHTNIDGSDVTDYLNRLFYVLNTSNANRGELPDYLAKFPFVNGGLFAKELPAPIFTTQSRCLLIECGKELDWSDINPDIFGSMIQAVVHPDQRSGMGMHYTSVTNIMKVIEPLFLDELYTEFENIEENIDLKLKPSRLRKLHDRIAGIKIFDPACGSGNFLIIAFKELRKLEMEIIKRLQELEQNENQDDLFGDVGLDSSFSRIKLSKFYGIELDDFAHEVAILSLWLAEHQMNVEFKAEFGECSPSLPLKESGNVVHGNATRIGWNDVCDRDGEIYLLGNPPYLGFKMQDKEQKEDIANVFSGIKNYKKLDYISCWFLLASKYIENRNAKFSFVSTNSICQGEHVGLLWPNIYKCNLEISSAHRSFKWVNNAKYNAGVTCIIVGVRNISKEDRYIYDDGVKQRVSVINSYLSPSSSSVVLKRSKPLSNFTPMTLGNMPKDDGNFILTKDEVNDLISKYPQASKFIKKLIGANEFINGTTRWCLWILEENLEEAYLIDEIKTRIEKVKIFRESSTDRSANIMALTPFKFREQKVAEVSSLIIPTVTSERRDYIPMGFLDKETVIVAPNNAIYDPEQHIFSIISSKMHMTWIKAVAGRLETRIRYSSALCYNTFPFPDVTAEQKGKLVESLLEVLSQREIHSDKTIAKLYDPDLMPEGLLQAHQAVDDVVDKCYRQKPFSTDEERLSFLFKKYDEMTGGQNA